MGYVMKKWLEIVKNVLIWGIVAFSVIMIIFTLISVNALGRKDRSLFGFKFFIVQSDSMSATHFSAGDIVITKKINVSKLKEGDVITFISQNSDNYGATVTHKIRKVITDKKGGVAFVTYGTTTNTDDAELVTEVIGKYIGHISYLGRFFVFLKTTPGYVLFVLSPFLLLIISKGIKCIRIFKNYKKEQIEEIKKEYI